jgi:hypothetical protein
MLFLPNDYHDIKLELFDLKFRSHFYSMTMDTVSPFDFDLTFGSATSANLRQCASMIELLNLREWQVAGRLQSVFR